MRFFVPSSVIRIKQRDPQESNSKQLQEGNCLKAVCIFNLHRKLYVGMIPYQSWLSNQQIHMEIT